MTFARSGLPGLLGTIARSAAISGAARVAAGSLDERVRSRRAAEQRAPGVPSASPAGKEWLADQLEILAELHAAHVLTDREFAAAKARLLS
ncbi:SHOCT domain-containing protein [Arthrobacter sulfonylureivorans]|uniref:SHOCT domain-containing protein n=1 Tax=Arthrobacter sulfonylureivorans TaxID=2486855 RepID=UPI0010AD4628|nr:SHOCT domain-containing protein [Arthrobacter sp. CAU 1506]